MRRPTNRFHGLLSLTAAAATALCAGAVLPVSAAPAPGNVEFAVEGIGVGHFADARLAANPGASDEVPAPLCLMLQGPSPDNQVALREWFREIKSDDASSSRPDAILTVPNDRDGLRKGVYRLTDVTIRHVELDAERESPAARLQAAEIACASVEPASTPAEAG